MIRNDASDPQLVSIKNRFVIAARIAFVHVDACPGNVNFATKTESTNVLSLYKNFRQTEIGLNDYEVFRQWHNFHL